MNRSWLNYFVERIRIRDESQSCYVHMRCHMLVPERLTVAEGATATLRSERNEVLGRGSGVKQGI